MMVFVDICPYEDNLTPLRPSVLICKTGKIIVYIFPVAMAIEALSSISAQSMLFVIIVTIIVIVTVINHHHCFSNCRPLDILRGHKEDKIHSWINRNT